MKTPPPGSDPQPQHAPTGRDVAAEWEHLRRWLDEPLRDGKPRVESLNLEDVSRRTGVGTSFRNWYRRAPHRGGKPRPAPAAHHLDKVQAFFEAYGYQRPTQI